MFDPNLVLLNIPTDDECFYCDDCSQSIDFRIRVLPVAVVGSDSGLCDDSAMGPDASGSCGIGHNHAMRDEKQYENVLRSGAGLSGGEKMNLFISVSDGVGLRR